MKRCLFVVCWLLVLAACGPAQQNTGAQTQPRSTAAPGSITNGTVDIPQATMVYYDISGSTERDLRTQLDARRPRGPDGEKHDALTTWDFTWTWPGYGKSSCTLTAAKVNAKIEVKFPRWKAPKAADPDLVARWTEYTERLAEHEKGHVDLVLEKKDAVVEAIKAASCTAADDQAEAVVESINQDNAEYDAETNHGATQGARFP